MPEKSCPLEVNESDYEELKKAEFCLIREYKRKSDGSRFSKLICFGTKEECEREITGLLIVFDYLEYIGDFIIPTKKLLPPVDQT